MEAGQFTNTAINMVQVVTNIIEDYRMGSFRALAQEPVQNALDARRRDGGKVAVEYRLLRRETSANKLCRLLTVTDSGTTGLRGPLVTDEELQTRDFKLKPDENWAAFEAQGYTKENEDALGSRGQGKAAFLYHSHVPGLTRRMVMLYDTLLEDGEYRLGLRFARPVDQRRSPPFKDEEAKAIVQRAEYPLDDSLAIPLGLDPLDEIGTRVVVPFLKKDEARNMCPGGELSAWLQRCWWRAIQLGKLQIRVVDDATGDAQTIEPPSWWEDFKPLGGKPSANGIWRNLPNGGRACVWGDLPVDGEHEIRRLVLLHSDIIDEDEIVKDEPEYAGIQIMRRLQWIETRGARQAYHDYIPADKRPGFRGFVEFSRHTESALRQAEYSTHDGFNGRMQVVKHIRAALEGKVIEFSERMGWKTATTISEQQVNQREKSTHSRFMETFLNPNGRKPKGGRGKSEPADKQLLWDCRLDLEYPDPATARVNWGRSLSNVSVALGCEPCKELVGSAHLILEWVDEAGQAREILRYQDAIRGSWLDERIEEAISLGDWQIVSGKANLERQISCPDPGQYHLRATVEYDATRVKSAARTVYVQEEPPPPPQKNPITLSINAVNASDGKQKRIEHGQGLDLRIISRNRTTKPATLFLNASLRRGEFAELFANQMPVEMAGTPAGDSPIPKDILSLKRQLLDPHQSIPMTIESVQALVMPDSSGKYTISAELVDEDGERVIRTTAPIYFQRDPDNAKNNLPFEIKQVTNQREMWKLNNKLDLLTYPGAYPLYLELKDGQRQRHALHGRQAFIAEISANGLLEWAFRPREESSDDSNYDQLLASIGSPDDPLWEPYHIKLKNLCKASESHIAYAQIWRETVAVMLEIYAKENS